MESFVKFRCGVPFLLVNELHQIFYVHSIFCYHANTRKNNNQERQAALTEKEAFRILGLPANADAEQVRKEIYLDPG